MWALCAYVCMYIGMYALRLSQCRIYLSIIGIPLYTVYSKLRIHTVPKLQKIKMMTVAINKKV